MRSVNSDQDATSETKSALEPPLPPSLVPPLPAPEDDEVALPSPAPVPLRPLVGLVCCVALLLLLEEEEEPKKRLFTLEAFVGAGSATAGAISSTKVSLRLDSMP